jgi:hypothetical protein
VSEYRIFLTVVPNTECKEPRIRDRHPARLDWRDNKCKGIQTRSPSIFCRDGFASQKFTSAELTWCSNKYGSARLCTVDKTVTRGPSGRHSRASTSLLSLSSSNLSPTSFATERSARAEVIEPLRVTGTTLSNLTARTDGTCRGRGLVNREP